LTGIETGRIAPVERVAAYITVGIAGRADGGVSLEELRCRWIVVAGAEVDEPGFGVGVVAGVAETG
jgi:hypothetical protein